MATSGSATTNSSAGGYFWVKWSRTGYSDKANTSTISWSCGAYCGYDYYSNAVRMSAVSINGTEVYGGGTYSYKNQGNNTLASGSLTIQHNTNGTKTFSISSFSGWFYPADNHSADASSHTLDSLDRSAPTISFSVSDITANSFKINATSSDTCNQWKYSLDGVEYDLSDATGTSASVIVTGLSPAHTYSVRVYAKRTQNDVVGYSSTTSYKTLGGSVINSIAASPLVIDGGEESTSFIANITMYESSYTHTLKLMYGSDELKTFSPTITKGTSDYTLSLLQTESQPEKSTILALFPNSQSITCQLELETFSGSTKIGNTSSKDIVLKTTEANSKPTFSNFNFIGSGPARQVLGNDNYLLQGISYVQITPNRAEAHNSATITGYNAVLGSAVKFAPGAPSTFDLGVPNEPGVAQLTVSAVDSRGYTTSVSKTVTILPYESPRIATVDVKRRNNYDPQISVKIRGQLSSITVENDDKNTIQTLQYQYKKTNEDDTAWSGWIDITDPDVSGTSFSFETTQLTTLSTSYSYNIEFRCTDKLSTSAVYSATINSGVPLMAARTLENGEKYLGVGNPNPQYKLDVGGDTNISESIYFSKIFGVAWLDFFFPVGKLIFVDDADFYPNEYYGGTWEKVAEGKAIYGADGVDFISGQEIEAGLPNITGNLYGVEGATNQANSWGFRPITEGFVSVSSTGNAYNKYNGDYTMSYGSKANFDASRSSSIYGKSDTVQPPAYPVYIWKRLENIAIKTQPVNPMVFPNHEAINYSIEAMGKGLQYQWQYYDDGEWLDYTGTGFDTDSITIPKSYAYYKFRCYLTDEYGGELYSDEVQNDNGYQEVEWLMTTGTQYIKSNITSSPSVEFECTLQAANSSAAGLNGYGSAGSKNALMIGATGITYGDNYQSTAVDISDLEPHTINVKSGSQTFDGAVISTRTMTTTGEEMYLFAMRPQWVSNRAPASFCVNVHIINFKFKQNGTLTRDMIPCYRKSDGVIGMYDLCGSICSATNTPFYVNSGSGTFTKGGDVI